MTALRPYQRDIIRRIEDAIASGQRRILVVAPTGSGKTVVASEHARRCVEHGRCVLFLSHRREITQQTAEKLWRVGRIDAGVIQAGFEPRPGQRLQVASVQTLHRRAISGRKMDLPPADCVVVDEAHHVRAKTWSEILDAFPNAAVIGLTATPCRGDGRGLGNVFDVMLECPPVAELIGQGFLVGTKVFAPVIPDLKDVKVARGDYVERQLAERMDQAVLIGDIVHHWHKLADRRPTIVFASSIAHSVHVRDEFRRAGVLAEHLDGSTPADERDEILAKLENGRIEVVSNCMVLTEGWDQPVVSCVVMARPTKQLGLYRQMVGRGLRPAPGKDHLLILDHSGATFQHGFAEDPIDWTLETDKRAENPMHRSRSEGSARSLTTCPECMAVRFAGKPCSACGWRPRPRAEAPDVIDGELGLLDRDRLPHADLFGPDEKAQFHRQLLWIAREHGYKPGWAAHKHREKFGDWPEHHHATPEAPSDAVRAWVRSRQIAFAKAQQKARAS